MRTILCILCILCAAAPAGIAAAQDPVNDHANDRVDDHANERAGDRLQDQGKERGNDRAGDDRFDDRASNFDTCVTEATQHHTDRMVKDTYYYYECEGPTAEKLAARPDECGSDVRPSPGEVKRWWDQLEDGLYLRVKWGTGRCAGLCQTRLYTDARKTTHRCELHRLMSRGPDAGSR